jgi:hypothetical protein
VTDGAKSYKTAVAFRAALETRLLFVKERVETDINGYSLARLQESGENG